LKGDDKIYNPEEKKLMNLLYYYKENSYSVEVYSKANNQLKELRIPKLPQHKNISIKESWEQF